MGYLGADLLQVVCSKIRPLGENSQAANGGPMGGGTCDVTSGRFSADGLQKLASSPTVSAIRLATTAAQNRLGCCGPQLLFAQHRLKLRLKDARAAIH